MEFGKGLKDSLLSAPSIQKQPGGEGGVRGESKPAAAEVRGDATVCGCFHSKSALNLPVKRTGTKQRKA